MSCRRVSERLDNNVYKKFFQDFVRNSVATNLPANNGNSKSLDFDMASATTADDHHYKLSVASSDTGDQVCGYAELTPALMLAIA